MCRTIETHFHIKGAIHKMTSIHDIAVTAELIHFKRILLQLDLPTRRVLLSQCLDCINSHPQEQYTVGLRDWFTRCLVLSEPDQFDEIRKAELLTSAFWNTLYEMHKSELLHHIASAIVHNLR